MHVFTTDLLDRITDDGPQASRILLFSGARILTGDPLIGDVATGDLLLGGERIVGVGPGLLTAADDDGAIVVDCAGCTIVPAVVDVAGLRGLRPEGSRSATGLVPGNPATFAVLRGPGSPDGDPIGRLLGSLDSAAAVVVDGVVVRWDGRPVPTGVPARSGFETPEPRLGTWVDETGFVHQHLTADGRYDETRGGRPHAYQGSFRITGDRIDYHDDLGFRAFGEFEGDALHHAGYVFHRA